MPKPTHKAFLIKVLQFILFLTAGFLLLYLALRNHNLSELWEVLLNADYKWAFFILIITILNHISRTLRWNQLIQTIGDKPYWFNAFISLMLGYLVSYGIPRAGDVSRCLALKKIEKTPFLPLLGTVIIERSVDIICLFLAIFLSIILEYQKIFYFFQENILFPLIDTYKEFISSGNFKFILLLVFVLVITTFSIIYFKKRNSFPLINKLKSYIKDIKKGFLAIFHLKDPILFILHTLFIWGTYLLMTWLWTFSLDETASLGISAGLTLMAVGSLGRSIPIQGGGIGAYHYLIINTAIIFGISELGGAALAMLIYGFQTLYYLIIGGASTILVMVMVKETKSEK